MSYEQQSRTKRQKMRLDIRRRTIEQYQSKIRKRMINQLNQERYNFSIQNTQESEVKQEYNRKQFHQQNIKRENMQICSKQQNDQFNQEKNQSTSNKYTFFNNKMVRLEQLSLTNSQHLCNIKILQELKQFIYLPQRDLIQQKIQKIMTKITLNQINWDSNFLKHLFDFLLQLIQNHYQIDQYLKNLSQCCLIQNKNMCYILFFNSQIILSHLQSLNKSILIKIIENFIRIPPIVDNNRLKCVYPEKQINIEFYLDKILKLIFNILIKSQYNKKIYKKILFKQALNTQQKQFIQILDIVQYLFHRLDGEQKQKIILLMSQQKWELNHILLNYYFKQTKNSKNQHIFNGNTEIKIKYKLLQINRNILQSHFDFETNGKIVLQFLYTFLPNLLKIIIVDLQNQIDNYQFQQKQQYQRNKKFNISQLQRKYYVLILDTLYIMLTITDQIGDLPALEYINAAFPNFLQLFFNFHSQHCQKNNRKYRMLINYSQILLKYIVKPCKTQYLINFIEQIILKWQFCQNNNKQISYVIETIIQVLKNHDCNFSKECQDCPFILKFSQPHIINKLEQLSKHLDYELSHSVETILQILNNFQ